MVTKQFRITIVLLALANMAALPVLAGQVARKADPLSERKVIVNHSYSETVESKVEKKGAFRLHKRIDPPLWSTQSAVAQLGTTVHSKGVVQQVGSSASVNNDL